MHRDSMVRNLCLRGLAVTYKNLLEENAMSSSFIQLDHRIEDAAMWKKEDGEKMRVSQLLKCISRAHVWLQVSKYLGIRSISRR
jgi:hypothetical protein